MKAQSPNYTQAPNILFDEWLPELKEGELRVALVIVRQTFGFHRDEHEMSVSRLAELSGMSRRAVISALDGLMEKGIVSRREKGQSYLYSLVIESNQSKGELVTLGNQLPVTQGNQLDGQVVTESNQPSLYKETKDSKKQTDKEIIAEGTSAPAESKPLTAWQMQLEVMSKTIAAVTGDDLNIETAKKRVGQVAAQLVKAGYVPEDLSPFWQWYKQNDWRGKAGQRPTREQVLSELPRWKNSIALKKAAPADGSRFVSGKYADEINH